ncbi:MAG: ABC transporter ATP-binding protein [Firmicutes bacterium]|nr:ABC transporter ATP-binding protein [Bacillota bacterium]
MTTDIVGVREPLFTLKKLTYFYPEADLPALQEINLDVEEGEFLLVVGGSGSGKSSLARALAGLIPDYYGGRIGGRNFFKGQDIGSMKQSAHARNIGIVFQDPEKQLVMTSVEAEIAFGLENLGLPQPEMFRRVAEVMSFFGISSLRREFTAKLSGGQKQKVALASILAMQPQVLILDEPTSQLDPLAAEEIFNLVKRLNEELNITIILIEQRLERCYHLADRVAVMEGGRIVKDGTAREVADWEVKNRYPYVPAVAGFFSHIGSHDIPLTIKEGRCLLKNQYTFHNVSAAADVPAHNQAIKNTTKINPDKPQEFPVVEINKLWFSYPNGREALRGIDFSVVAGEYVAVLGENGSGKTTLLKQIAGLLKPSRGKVSVDGVYTDCSLPHQLARVVGYLSQNPNDYLFNDTVEEELRFTQVNLGISDTANIDQWLEKLNLTRYRHANPRDLSSGERQRVALASIMVASPRLLLLDEPTRGIDYRLKAEMGRLLKEMARSGTAVILVTHDVEFAAEYSERVVMLFDGRIAYDGPKKKVLSNSMFFAPQIRKLFRGIDDELFTIREAVERVRNLTTGNTR